MSKPTQKEIDEFTLRLGITPNAYIGEAAFKYALKEYCNYLAEGKTRPLMTALYVDTSNYLLKVNPDGKGKNPARSERNIRFIIEKTWGRQPHTKTLDEIFMYYNGENKPSNVVFISSCASYLLEEIEKKDKTQSDNTHMSITEFEEKYMSDRVEKEARKRLSSNTTDEVPENIKKYIDETVSKIVKESVKEVFKYLLTDVDGNQ